MSGFSIKTSNPFFGVAYSQTPLSSSDQMDESSEQPPVSDQPATTNHNSEVTTSSVSGMAIRSTSTANVDIF